MVLFFRISLFLSFIFPKERSNIVSIFSADTKNQFVLDIEASLARAQASQGIIPKWAADEISKKAHIKYLNSDELKTETEKVRHRMVALLNVWTKTMEDGAGQYVHFGATTVDIYDNVLVLQLKSCIHKLIDDLRTIELALIGISDKHKNTIMVGRTLGQHALPISFGKKTSTWLGENRRNIERLKEVFNRVNKSGILKGAVGTYLGYGPKGIETENLVMQDLGLDTSYPDDWHGSRDVIAEYASTLARISKSFGRIGNELFLLQITDIGETQEVLNKRVVGSSTMPHKKNPSKSEVLIHLSRTIPRLSEVLLDDMINSFERDHTKWSTEIVEQISIETGRLLSVAMSLISSFKVNPEKMISNLKRTDGLIMSQRVVFALANDIGKKSANDLIHKIAQKSLSKKSSFEVLLNNNKTIRKYLNPNEIKALLNPETYIGLTSNEVDRVIEYVNIKRKED